MKELFWTLIIVVILAIAIMTVVIPWMVGIATISQHVQIMWCSTEFCRQVNP